MADLIERNIEIVEMIYMIECRTHSNNLVLRKFCYNCLCKSKTNKEFISYSMYPSLSPYRMCLKCGCMTMNMACSLYNVPADTIYLYAEEGLTFDELETGETISFNIENELLLKLKGLKIKWQKNKHKSKRMI